MGTLVRRGRGVAVVTATADSTEFGIIFKMLDVGWARVNQCLLWAGAVPDEA